MRILEIAFQIAATEKRMVRVDDAYKLVRKKRGNFQIRGAIERRDRKIIIARSDGLESIISPGRNFDKRFAGLLGGSA